MKAYQQFTVEDFLMDARFLAWVKHGQPEARQFWEQWQRENPQQRATLLLAKDMAEALKNRPHNLSVEQEILEVERIVKLASYAQEPSRWQRVQQSFSHRYWQVAATILLISGIGLGWFLLREKPGSLPETVAFSENEKPPNDQWVSQVNGTSQPVDLTLPDGSRMRLMPNSEARYPRTFNLDQREIQLKGEATFSVVHEGKRPFLVYSGPLVTRVLGTRFRVQARAGESRMKVSVISGKVSVMDRRDWKTAQRPDSKEVPGVVLTANQQVTYDASQSRYQKELVTQPAVLAQPENRESFNFEDTPASGVFERLKKAYGVEIIYDPTVLRNCTLTASMAGVPLHDQLRLLCASIGASYEVVDARIIVTSKGCQ
ncbi:FecR family protein [Larkinella rosea]|uniref:FecR family protein n=1 Tax=Larkinella rosea TaxID=2025312 RepID=A0A3P1BJH6_9BACT|nr:FecR family protein [Larkinella rosea]RRB01056.1 FecR family protein [Larkinella rosea]